MKITNILLSAFRALQRNKMRSFLTMLGIIIGVGAVIAMLAIGQGAQFSVEQQINALGTNVLIVLPGTQQTSGVRVGAGSVTTLTEDDALAIQISFAQCARKGRYGLGQCTRQFSRTAPGGETEILAVPSSQHTEQRVAQLHCPVEHSFEHRREVAW